MSGRALGHREIDVYRPFPGETPVELVGEGADPDDVRIAKVGGAVAGAYRLARTGPCVVAIAAIGVFEGYRGRGVGRWLLGHALGIAESRGAREVHAPDVARAFFAKAGFEPARADAAGPAGAGLRLSLTPE